MEVVGTSEVFPCVGHIFSGLGRVLETLDYEYRQRAILQGEICDECVEGMAVDASFDRGVDDPFTFGVHLGDSHMDEVEAVGVAGGAGDGGVH